MIDSMVVFLVIFLSAVIVFNHLRKQMTKVGSTGTCADCPLHKHTRTPKT